MAQSSTQVALLKAARANTANLSVAKTLLDLADSIDPKIGESLTASIEQIVNNAKLINVALTAASDSDKIR